MQLENHSFFYVFMGTMQGVKKSYSSLQTLQMNDSFFIGCEIGISQAVYS